MYLKRIEIQGFKSFADPVTIDFRQGVTCIVGPNGSGKSNISDAMRWVLGEQSAKTLRGGKMEEIIFAGTDARRPKGMAEVTLVLDNSAGGLEIDYAEVAITRRLFRSGESEYFINGNQCRLRDIRELIMDTGLGVDGYSFIGQGRVEKIVSDKPESRREVFEEAAGIIKYKSKRAEAERRLESAGTNLDRLSDIIFDIESRIDGLREESSKAKEYAELSKRYRELEINITLKNIDNLQGKNSELTEQFEDAGKALEDLRGEKVETEAKLSGLRAQDMALEEKANAVRERITENVTRSMSIENEAAVSEERQKGALRERQRLAEEIAEYESRLEAREKAFDEITAQYAGLGERLEALDAELALVLSAAAEKEAAYAARSVGVDELRTAMFELSRERSAKEAELVSAEALVSSFDDTEDQVRLAQTQGAANRLVLEQARNETRAAAEANLHETEALRTEGEALRVKSDAAAREASDLRLHSESVRLESEKKSSRRRTIEEMESNYEGYAAGVRFLMNEKPHGIRGVVAELMKAETGYETAIEMALGPALQHIICETDEDAKAAIRILKENKAGRLTFLPIGTIRSREAYSDKAIEGAKGFLGYAEDRISADAEYDEIFGYLLGKTAIAETLDDAVAMSKQGSEGYRIVTLSGEIVNPAGALTGGAYRNKSANLLERRNEAGALSLEVAALEEKSTGLTRALEEAAEKSARLLIAIRENDAARREKELQAVRAEEELKSLEYRLVESDRRVKAGDAELADIAKDRESSSGMIEALRLEIRSLTQKIEEAQAGMEAGTADLASAKAEASVAAEAATLARLKAAEAGRDKENADAVIDTHRRGLEEVRDGLAARRDAFAGLAETGGTLSGEAASAEMAALKEAKAALDAELERILAERRETRMSINEKELTLSRSEEKIEARASAKNGMEVELGRQETRLQTWKEKLFEEFELSYVHALEYRNPDFVMSQGVKENREVKDRLREIGDVNPGSIREYEETSERYTFLTAQRDDVLASMKDFRDIVTDMDKISKEKFRDTFDKVSETFSETFTLLFGGGTGQILLEDENDPLECGIDIKIRPPGKGSLASIDSYSGGEKSMIAIALLFSILKAKPTPFCILDEIDAALDETNIHRFADYVAKFEETQFALVTHQRSTMEYADALFGVTMQEQGVTSVLSLLLGEKETEEFAEKLA
ncbi:chromosome partition protein Smc [Clostridia bacterium]|nr:chromosome partition protein Smc [Clostridia bacterium]